MSEYFATTERVLAFHRPQRHGSAGQKPPGEKTPRGSNPTHDKTRLNMNRVYSSDLE